LTTWTEPIQDQGLVAQHANHIKDEVEWMEHVITLSEVLAPSEVPEILASRQMQLQEEKQKAQQASTAKTQAADTVASSTRVGSDEAGSDADADVHADADVDSDADADMDADTDVDADADMGVRMTRPASGRGGDDADGHREVDHHSGVRSNGSGRAASSNNGASTNNSSHQPVQGETLNSTQLLSPDHAWQNQMMLLLTTGKSKFDYCCTVICAFSFDGEQHAMHGLMATAASQHWSRCSAWCACSGCVVVTSLLCVKCLSLHTGLHGSFCMMLTCVAWRTMHSVCPQQLQCAMHYKLSRHSGQT